MPFQELSANADGTSSAPMREQVQQARDCQTRRFGADSTPQQPHDEQAAAQVLPARRGRPGAAANRRWTTWACRRGRHDRILRMARTIADLEGAADIKRAAPDRGDRLPQPGSEAVEALETQLPMSEEIS